MSKNKEVMGVALDKNVAEKIRCIALCKEWTVSKTISKIISAYFEMKGEMK